jgi:exodeoxyribonuclease-3
MLIVSWNVNSVRVRLEQALSWIQQHNPHIILLQEIKCQTEFFPREAFEDAGYNCLILGQKTYNGVAILSKSPIEDQILALPTLSPPFLEARYIEAFTAGIRVASVYVPNGSSVDSPAYLYKLNFLKNLKQHLENLITLGEIQILAGDFNVAPSSIDVYDPVRFENEILFTKPERAHFQDLLDVGYYDGIRQIDPTEVCYTWWNYKGNLAKNQGARIDHFLLSPEASKRLQSAGVDVYPRHAPRPSDHAPIWCELKIEE